jgi:DASH complex subunit DAD2
MSYGGRPLHSHLRHPSTSGNQASTGQSPLLLARINEKKAELASLKELQALSAGLADQMQQLEQKLATLTDGTEGTHVTFGGAEPKLMISSCCDCPEQLA